MWYIYVSIILGGDRRSTPENNNRDATCEEVSWRVTTPTVGSRAYSASYIVIIDIWEVSCHMIHEPNRVSDYSIFFAVSVFGFTVVFMPMWVPSY